MALADWAESSKPYLGSMLMLWVPGVLLSRSGRLHETFDFDLADAGRLLLPVPSNPSALTLHPIPQVRLHASASAVFVRRGRIKILVAADDCRFLF
jgi:hypothetical protein